MDVFDNAICKIIGSRPSFQKVSQNHCKPEASIAVLALFIEQGKKFWEDAFAEEHSSFNIEFYKHLTIVKHLLLENELIIESLMIALVRDLKASHGNQELAAKSFVLRIFEIFPPETADKLVQLSTKKWMECRTDKADYLRTEQAWKDHYEKIRSNLLPSSPTTQKTNDKTNGTKTQIVPCPNPECREPKRVSPETKRFRCKKCGLDRAYPFI